MLINRRKLLLASGLAAMAAPFGDFAVSSARAADEPILRFGLIADPQYAAAVPNLEADEGLGRFYSNTLTKLPAAIDALNQEDLSFVITLGDIIDRDWESYSAILPIYAKLKHKNLYLLGNHDYSVDSYFHDALLQTMGMTERYYDFGDGGYRFVVLDGNDVSLFAPPAGDPRREQAQKLVDELKAKGAANANTWNGALSEEQYAWLESTVDKAKAAGEKVILLNHDPIDPDGADIALDAERLRTFIAGAPNVVAYFSGHHHTGGYGEVNGKHLMNFKAMVTTADTTAYSIVELYADRLEIKGVGREESRTLMLPA